MGKKLTTKEFIEKSKKIHGDKYDYSNVRYKTSATKVTIICPEHGEFEQRPNDHLRGQRCPKCSNRKRKNNEDFILESKKIHGNKYDYSKVEYKNNNTNVTIICPGHGEFKQIPKNHLSGSGCPFCANNVKLTTKEFIEKSKKIHGDKYDYSKVEYKGTMSKVTIICPEHGEFEQTANSHLSGSGCQHCDLDSRLGKLKLTTKEFIEKSKKIHGNKYDYSNVEYKGSYEFVDIICPEHGEFKQKSYIHLGGSGCQICKESKGEKEVRAILIRKGVKFEPQYKFDDCKNVRLLPFDFYLPDLNMCIEYDGKQHFEPVKRFGGEKEFKKRKVNDKIKSSYCQNNHIELVRISYKENISVKIDKLLDE